MHLLLFSFILPLVWLQKWAFALCWTYWTVTSLAIHTALPLVHGNLRTYKKPGCALRLFTLKPQGNCVSSVSLISPEYPAISQAPPLSPTPHSLTWMFFLPHPSSLLVCYVGASDLSKGKCGHTSSLPDLKPTKIESHMAFDVIP